MNELNDLHELEYDFCGRLNSSGELSADINRQNKFIDIVSITSVKTNKAMSVVFDFSAETMSFWDNNDTKHCFLMNENGLESLLITLNEQFRNTYFIQTVKDKQIISSFRVLLTNVTDDSALKKVLELKSFIDDAYDYIDAFNFIGNHHYKFDMKQNM